MNKVEEFKEIIKNSKKIVVFSGAGLSVASGIPDFRSSNGLYSKEYMGLSPEEIVSHTFFMNHTDLFYKFYFEKMIFNDALPNIAHKYFSKINATIVTQNIDDLHGMAGSKEVYELHGSVKRNYCMKCHKFYSLDELKLGEIPRCSCGGIIKPDVVLYEEGLDELTVNGAINSISMADTLIIVGTSLRVYPAASFIRFFNGKNLILINKEKAPVGANVTLEIIDSVEHFIEEVEK